MPNKKTFIRGRCKAFQKTGSGKLKTILTAYTSHLFANNYKKLNVKYVKAGCSKRLGDFKRIRQIADNLK